MKSARIIVCFVFLSVSAWAQKSSGSDLEFAQSQLLRIEKKLNGAISTPGAASPCEIEWLKVDRKYYSWFIRNEKEIRSRLAGKSDDVIQYVQSRLNQLYGMMVSTEAVSGQTSSQEVTFQLALKHFDLVNQKIKACQETTPNELSVLLNQINDPELSPFRVSNDQVVDALKILTTGMNSSLKEVGVELSLEVTQNNHYFIFNLNVNRELDGKVVKISIPLTGTSPPHLDSIRVSSEAEWVSTSTLDGYPVDAQKRYHAMQMESKYAMSCFRERLAPSQGSNAVFLKTSDLRFDRIWRGRKDLASFGMGTVCAVKDVVGGRHNPRGESLVGFIVIKNGIATLEDWGGPGRVHPIDGSSLRYDESGNIVIGANTITLLAFGDSDSTFGWSYLGNFRANRFVYCRELN